MNKRTFCEVFLAFVAFWSELELVVSFTAMRRDPVSHFKRQVETVSVIVLRQNIDHPQAVTFMPENEVASVTAQEVV